MSGSVRQPRESRRVEAVRGVAKHAGQAGKATTERALRASLQAEAMQRLRPSLSTPREVPHVGRPDEVSQQAGRARLPKAAEPVGCANAVRVRDLDDFQRAGYPVDAPLQHLQPSRLAGRHASGRTIASGTCEQAVSWARRPVRVARPALLRAGAATRDVIRIAHSSKIAFAHTGFATVLQCGSSSVHLETPVTRAAAPARGSPRAGEVRRRSPGLLVDPRDVLQYPRRPRPVAELKR
jgi:hypothetical protein